MSLSYLLSSKDYTVYNALTWGNCLQHYHKASSSRASCSQSLFHKTVALVEFIPLIGQITSLFEMAIAYLLKPSFADLTRREIRHIEKRGDPFFYAGKAIAYAEPFLDETSVSLTENPANLPKALFPLHRWLESFYRDLPWPAEIQNIVVLTEVREGLKDISTAAKAISLMQKFNPSLTFDWVIRDAELNEYDPLSFLKEDEQSRVRARCWGSEPSEKIDGHFLLTGPVARQNDSTYIESCIHRKISGPGFGFMEINGLSHDRMMAAVMLNTLKEASEPEGKVSQNLHNILFLSGTQGGENLLPMGIQPGTGVFFDQDRLDAPLSRGYCCPSYLPQIEDAGLRKDILEAMNVFDGQSTPDYDQHSFNSGYAERPESWGNFIDCVALHEKDKHVVIVLNQKGTGANLSEQEFQEQIFTPERVAFLKEKGYGAIVCKGQEDAAVLQEAENSETERRLIVIVRPSFTPNDTKHLQLASERLLAAKDHNAVEAFASRCKLYLYEDVMRNGNYKETFLGQQVDLAGKFSSKLARLLALFGKDRRLEASESFSSQLAEIEGLLNGSDLSKATLRFCDYITSIYSFDRVLEGALKRAAWHHLFPHLDKVEAEALGEEFQSRLIDYQKNPKNCEFSIGSLDQLGHQIRETLFPSKKPPNPADTEPLDELSKKIEKMLVRSKSAPSTIYNKNEEDTPATAPLDKKRKETRPSSPMSHGAIDTKGKEEEPPAVGSLNRAAFFSFISPSAEIIQTARIQVDILRDLYNRLNLLDSSQGQNLVEGIEEFRLFFGQYRDPQPDPFEINEMVKIFSLFDDIAANTTSIQTEFQRWSEFYKIKPDSDGVIPMPKDGNCWAHSAVVGLEHTNTAKKTHQELRADVVQWMREHHETDGFLSESIADAIEAHKYFERERIETEETNLNIIRGDFEAVLNDPEASEAQKDHALDQIIDTADRLDTCVRLKEALENFNTELYLDHMAQLGSHGGRAELYAISQLFGVNVAIWREFPATEDFPVRLSKDYDQQIHNPSAEHTINVVITQEGNHFNFRIQGSGLLS